MEDKFCTYKRVGYFKDKMAQDIGIRFTGTIYASPGVIKHIKNKHGKHLGKKIIEDIIGYMKEIINDPDYIGVYSIRENEIHIELIKSLKTNILVGIDINKERDYIFVSTMYPITDSKINNRIYSGKLKKYNCK